MTLSDRIRNKALWQEPKFDGACVYDWSLWNGRDFEAIRPLWCYEECDLIQRRMFLLFVAEALEE